MAKVIAINGSPRKDGNTAILIRHVLAELEDEGFETELVQFAGKRIRGCTACMKCFENRDKRCVFDDDVVNDCIEKMAAADSIVLGSPVYFTDVTAEMKALVDRAGFVSFANDGLFKRKVGSAVVAQRRMGAAHTLDTLLHFLLTQDVIIPGWSNPGHSPVPVGMGREIGDVEADDEGIAAAKNAGKNMAWILKALKR
ncbi:MAG: flavodoxin family protein [Halobacteriota archaeon]